MGSGGGGSSGSGETIVRYAPYIETMHYDFLYHVLGARTTAISNSPFKNYVDVEVDDAFFGAGFVISSFTSLYEMFGTYMSGLDLNNLWEQVFTDVVDSSSVGTLVSAEGALMDDDIETNILPRLQTGMRDINAVMSSSFVTGKAIIEDARAKSLAKFSADLRYRLIPVAESVWAKHLQWNQQVVSIYAEIMKFYFSAKTDVDETNYAMAAKDVLWPFTVLDFERAALGALQGAMNTKTDVAGASTAKKVIGGALSGGAMGAMVGAEIGGKSGGVYGAAIGAVVGGIAGAM